MTSRTEELLALARTRPLTPDERAQLDPEAAGQADPLALAEALAGGDQRLSPEEADRLFAGAARRAGKARPSWVRPVMGVALAAGLAAIVLARWPAPSSNRDGIKGAPATVSIALAAQRPGAREARSLSGSPILFSGEALRIVVAATGPLHVTLFEEEGGKLRSLWASPAAIPAGQTALGPGGEGLVLSPGPANLWLVSRDSPVPPEVETTRIALAATCPDCAFARIAVEQR